MRPRGKNTPNSTGTSTRAQTAYSLLPPARSRRARGASPGEKAAPPGRWGWSPTRCVSANHSALLTWLNVKGLSHGRATELSADFLKALVSRSGSYRRRARTATALRPDYEAVRERLVKEEVLHCDELWWPLGKKKGVVVTVQGRPGCLM